ncbi:Rpr2-domain-containing protein [Aspergillus japonicus CBS 114.51]|uniref:Rpr2-domain-containing protein n=2 Tax=Aspergillus TaxID=5052 RepID=A0A2V5HBG8_ASPV1|nr:Rpr2-domain-containing protein [Aspergillus japonicus CBS 114.51]PYI21725.1 Rpr2-domain-containing protein [Aspergillus violaceofuscus CBS 115571]RAH76677.1 Rpr2-domain-containing protein [Aspergillus japonicus CBS 114.51]
MVKGKSKGKKDSAGGVNSHIRARIDYLYKAATFLQAQSSADHVGDSTNETEDQKPSVSTRIVPLVSPSAGSVGETAALDGQNAATGQLPQLSRNYLSQMRGVSLKTQLRLPVDMKRSFCKRCDTLLLPGVTCTREMRNPSRGRRKPWAELLVIRCSTCGTEKRFPQTEKRSKKLTDRRQEQGQEKQDNQNSAGS